MNKEEFKKSVSNSLFPVLNEQVYKYILSLIIEHKFSPGEKINMTRISDELEVSRTPVRIALDRLVDEGLVTRTAQKGYSTCRIKWNDCLNLYKTRQLIEGAATYDATFRLNSEGAASLEEIISLSNKHREDGNLLATLQDDYDFHHTIVELSGNPHLLKAYESLNSWIRSYQYLIRSYQPERHRGARLHSMIFKAMKNHYPLEARNLAEQHIQDIIDTLAELIAQE